MKFEEDLFVYLWQNPYENNCNSYLIRGKKTLLIDPGHLRHLGHLFSQMEEDGLSPEEIDLVLLTHSHPDHMEGVEAFYDKPIKMAMSREEERYLQGNGRYLFEMMRQPIPKYRIDFFLREGEFLFGEKIFHIYQTPGHSPGSISIYWPERKVLFTGDVLFYGGIGRTDFIEGNPRLLMKSIENLSNLDVEILLSGHGEMGVGKAVVLQNFEYIRQNYYPYL